MGRGGPASAIVVEPAGVPQVKLAQMLDTPSIAPCALERGGGLASPGTSLGGAGPAAELASATGPTVRIPSRLVELDGTRALARRGAQPFVKVAGDIDRSIDASAEALPVVEGLTQSPHADNEDFEEEEEDIEEGALEVAIGRLATLAIIGTFP